MLFSKWINLLDKYMPGRDEEIVQTIRSFQVPTGLKSHVKAALSLEFLEAHDRRSWPEKFMPRDMEWTLQTQVLEECELFSVDKRQRQSYMRLIMASKGRHRDVAYGLSEPLLWRQKEKVVENLIAMGKRDYHAQVPTSFEMENGVLHVAVSYKHTSAYYDKGTISEQQAEAIWTTVKSMPYVNKDTEVRVWVDQNLHRTKFGTDREWHEFCLLPYACLNTVFVGNVDSILQLSSTRPWLWVEMITALLGGGIHIKSGLDIVADSEGTLEQVGIGYSMKTFMSTLGWWVGRDKNVDEVMHRATDNKIAIYCS